MDLPKHLERDHEVASFNEYLDGETRKVYCLNYHKHLHRKAVDHGHTNLGRVASYVVEEVTPPRPTIVA